MTKPHRSGVIRMAAADRRHSRPGWWARATLLRRGTPLVKLSHPVSPNQQTPLAQDELYIVVRGRGVLFHDGQRDPFGAGDLMFVAAGTEHHFEDVSEDLAVWVVVYGPEGGEVTA